MEREFVIGSVDWPQLIAVYTLAALAFFMVLEAFVPRRKLQQPLLWRWGNNLSLALLGWYVGMFASAAFVVYAAQIGTELEVGLLPAIDAGPVVSFMVLLLALQFANYVFHLAFHKIPLLWTLHAVHHTDVDLDVSSSYRHHPFEQLVSLPLIVPLVMLLGASTEVAVSYKLLEISASFFTHSNLRLPKSVDRVLRRVVVTPDFHRLHHCSEKTYTNSNYGGILPWFDYVFGTASRRPYADQEQMELGLEYRREVRDSRLDRMLIAPFSTPAVGSDTPV